MRRKPGCAALSQFTHGKLSARQVGKNELNSKLFVIHEYYGTGSSSSILINIPILFIYQINQLQGSNFNMWFQPFKHIPFNSENRHVGFDSRKAIEHCSETDSHKYTQALDIRTRISGKLHIHADFSKYRLLNCMRIHIAGKLCFRVRRNLGHHDMHISWVNCEKQSLVDRFVDTCVAWRMSQNSWLLSFPSWYLYYIIIFVDKERICLKPNKLQGRRHYAYMFLFSIIFYLWQQIIIWKDIHPIL